MTHNEASRAATAADTQQTDNADVHENYDSFDDKRTPLPLSRLISVFLIQGAEPVTATVIYPFINKFIRETGITNGNEAKTGYYAGIIESTFFFTECMTVVQWGYLSDRFGRRPVLLSAPLGLAFSMLVFGSSQTFWPLVWSRCFQGIFNGSIGVAKSVIAELTDSTNRGDAYAFSPLIWNTGVTIGPILGGLLSNPETQWPNSLGRIEYLKSHPYFLPCLIAAIFCLVVFMITFLTLRETLPSIVAQQKAVKIARDGCPNAETALLSSADESSTSYGARPQHHSRQATASSENSTLVDQPKPPNDGIRSILIRPVLMTCLNHIFLAFLDMSHFALIPLMYSTPLEFGGLGLDPFQIGFTLGTFGFLNALIQSIFLGGLIRKHGARKIYMIGFSSFLVCFSMYPCMKYFSQRAQRVDALTIMCMLTQLGFQMMISMAYASIQVLLVDSVPEGGRLGTANGILQMIGSGMRSIAPTFASSLFSISLQKHLAGGNMVYFILLAMTLVGVRCTWLLPLHDKRKRRSS
ncbi:hypothetical protein D9613_007944 [Agrocybe pediades]|uniref:Major facilitator superfamily (MFS) profile domain-containing protein n=1 Tax=Agrocybe pediades TaxID=84607 RepID=A0A8H4QN43_9AGAR|nr:hypothetical protein D9613_007944 [Agrocybe pediades]